MISHDDTTRNRTSARAEQNCECLLPRRLPAGPGYYYSIASSGRPLFASAAARTSRHDYALRIHAQPEQERDTGYGDDTTSVAHPAIPAPSKSSKREAKGERGRRGHDPPVQLAGVCLCWPPGLVVNSSPPCQPETHLEHSASHFATKLSSHYSGRLVPLKAALIRPRVATARSACRLPAAALHAWISTLSAPFFIITFDSEPA